MTDLTHRQIDAARDAAALVRLLIDAGDPLPPRLGERIVSFGPAVIPLLIALLEDRALSLDAAVGESLAQYHAVGLLGELRATAAIEPMLRLLGKTDWGATASIHDALHLALPKLGPGVLEPALVAYAATTDAEYRSDLASVLAQIGVCDDRVYQILVAEFRRDPSMHAASFAVYGDPRALPLLAAALDRFEVQGTHPHRNHDLIEFKVAIHDLGGQITSAQQEKVDRAHGPYQERRQ